MAGIEMSSNIMFVDSWNSVLVSLDWVFRDSPYRLYTYNNPLDALEILKETEFAVVAAELWLPEMDGLKFLKHVSGINPDTVLMIVTFDSNYDTLQSEFCTIFKPWDNWELESTVENAVEQYECKTKYHRQKRYGGHIENKLLLSNG